MDQLVRVHHHYGAIVMVAMRAMRNVMCVV